MKTIHDLSTMTRLTNATSAIPAGGPLDQISLKAYLESDHYGVDRRMREWWSCLVQVGPACGTDATIAGKVRIIGRGDVEMMYVAQNSIDLPDDVGRRLLLAIFDLLFSRMNDLDGEFALMIRRDGGAWLRQKLSAADVAAVAKAFSRFPALESGFQPVLRISQ